MKHKFFKGFLVGTLATVGAVVGSVFAFKKTYVEPVETKVEEINDNRKRANRKRLSAHQG
ncbi:DUF3042 family protein [Lacticaseibacillus saniviri]|uniref:DUF3042 domain-containing protein n=1 Tax=Lacticaseibacillus saniviri JCM 17471 = DSM 24301 TaxID=1293598 RepID=A0A0R2N242_9LACO|nr:DUF3042 family protein [Lacticaseibacillus saniviri]KRO18555.1 hypothetical protein IV56_GL000832 [Lacticaseibacillus saniviri JCM 17471 = DSM 24301]MCG4281252.1 DUF3042 family protein [Lacticaseibacillus saniviri]